jgi:hypothetical protein
VTDELARHQMMAGRTANDSVVTTAIRMCLYGLGGTPASR